MTAQTSEIRNLLTLLFSAVAFAVALSGFFLWYYSAMGEYQVRHVLLAPDVLDSVSYTEQKTRFLFDRIEFSYYDEQQRQNRTFQIDREQYQKIYEILAKGSNVSETQQLEQSFYPQNLATLSLYIRSDQGDRPQIFQQVHILKDGNAFRVELRQQSNVKWAYFRLNDVFERILNTIIPES